MSIETLSKIYNALDPFKPATREQYLDCSSGRGGGVFSKEFISHLDLADDFLCILFTGHIGSGKSSELEELARTLSEPTPAGKQFFPVVVDANRYLDEYDTDPSDIFLAMVTETASQLKDRLGLELKDGYFKDRLTRLKSLFLSDLESDGGEISLFGLKGRIQALKKDRRTREAVREAVGEQQIRMLEAVNKLFEKANQMLFDYQEQSYAGLVIIVDNLEKVRVVGNHQEGIDSQVELFIERAPALNALAAHVIYTVPLRLARERGPELGQRFDQEPFVLPMVKIVEKKQLSPWNPGIQCLHHILGQRLEGLNLDQVFTPEALEFLVNYCGGSIRQLMGTAQNASSRVSQLPLDLRAVEGAVAQTVRAFSNSIPFAHYEKLARLDRSVNRHVDGQDPDCMSMLENQSILEYLNGVGENVFLANEPWYVVHPVVRELTGFKEAAKRLQAQPD